MEALVWDARQLAPYGGEFLDQEIRVHARSLGRAAGSSCPGNDTTTMTPVTPPPARAITTGR
jgi:hypothetical protein